MDQSGALLLFRRGIDGRAPGVLAGRSVFNTIASIGTICLAEQSTLGDTARPHNRPGM
jgi:hypothetical protein